MGITCTVEAASLSKQDLWLPVPHCRALSLQCIFYLVCTLMHTEDTRVAPAGWNSRKSWSPGDLFVQVKHCGQTALLHTNSHCSLHPVAQGPCCPEQDVTPLIASSHSEASNASVSQPCFLCYLLTKDFGYVFKIAV